MENRNKQEKDGPMPAILTLTGLFLVVIGTITEFFNIGPLLSMILGFMFAIYVVWLILFFGFAAFFKKWSMTRIGLVSLYFAIGTVLSLAGILK